MPLVNKSNKFAPLSLRDKIILLSAALMIVAYVCFNYLYVPVKDNIDNLNEQISVLTPKDFTPINEKINAIKSENTLLVERINEIKEAETGNSFNTQDFLIFLSNECEENQTKLIKFNDLGQTASNEGVWKLQYDFEIRGDISGINKICESIDKLGVRYSIGGMSLRQNKDYPYLERFFDGVSKLEWYEDPVPPTEDDADDAFGSDTLADSDYKSFPEYWYYPETQTPIATPIPTPTQRPTPTPTQESTPTPESTSEPTPETIPEEETLEPISKIEGETLEPTSETEEESSIDSVAESAIVEEANTDSAIESGFAEESSIESVVESVIEQQLFNDNIENIEGIETFTELTAYYRPFPKMMLLAAPSGDSNTLRLNITIEFIMYSDPELSHLNFGQEG